MVNYRTDLDNTFAALSHPTRRHILTRLEREHECTISDLAQPLGMKLPALMKHLDVLANASLIRRFKEGRTVTVRISPMPLRQALGWLHRYDRFWTPRLDRLKAYAEAKDKR
ncbi:MAG TPA: metalloregulator ArsR/SmtB family transcription factor [Gemmatimonadales bacterium]|nr:metalloregulator ArsR/SmtB family transcription factor [Gemmatimonadales bacterium]